MIKMLIFISTNIPIFLLLFALNYGGDFVDAKKVPSRRASATTNFEFQFTALHYNLTIFENAVNTIAQLDLEDCQRFEFGCLTGKRTEKIGGDDQQKFNAIAKKLGNFAFLIIEQKTDEVLNRELQNEFTLLIRATARRKKSIAMEASTTVRLRILDENDNNPMFKKLDYYTPQNAKIIQLEGFDADEGLNGELYYSAITQSASFYVEPKTGWIRSFVDKIKPGNYSMEFRIEDRASRLFYAESDDQQANGLDSALAFIRDRATVHIQLIFKPMEFAPYYYDSQLAGTIIVDNPSIFLDSMELKLVQQHNDSNELIVLERISNTEFDVKIWNTNGSIEYTIHVQVYEDLHKISEYTFELRPNFSRKIWLTTESKGDEAKKIYVNESLPIGYVIDEFRAQTTYSEEQNKIRYKLIQNQQRMSVILPFDLNPQTGQLRLKSSMDYESPNMQRIFDLTIAATLEINPNKSDLTVEQRIQIILQDSNDFCPEFLSLPENMQILIKSKNPKTLSESIIFTPKVIDRDGFTENSTSTSNSKLIYKLVGINGSDNYFDIDIKIANPLPENENVWKIKVVAMDLGWPLSHYTQIQLANVFDDLSTNLTLSTEKSVEHHYMNTCNLLNMYAPKFENDKDEIFHIIGQINANDEDFGYNGLVTYTFNIVDSFFGIDLYNGTLFTRKRPLTELLKQKLDKSMDFFDYRVEILAKDSALNETLRKSTKKWITIRIHGSNLNNPVFQKRAYNVQIPENNPIGEPLIKLKAVDRDFGQNGKVEYRLAVDVPDLMRIDPDTGIITLEKSLDREQYSKLDLMYSLARKTDFIQVLVMALDRGNPPNVGFVNVTIHIQDLNDNAPANILEDSPSGQLITCVPAYDLDTGVNAYLNYTLKLSQKEYIPFRVDLKSGCIFVDSEKPLNFAKQSNYSFNVQVLDNGLLPLSTLCAVEITLTEVNKNTQPPRFNDVAIEASVEENSPPRTAVFTVKAVDPEGTKVNYKLIGGTGMRLFDIEAETGLIYTLEELDYEENSFYWITVWARDSGHPTPLGSHLHVLVRVLNRNDRAPLFTKPIYFAEIVENSAENKVVIKVEATDPDSSTKQTERNAGSIKYSIIKGNPQSNFVIDESTGYILSGKRRLDRETQAEHELEVKGCDNGQLPLCTTAMVVVTVLDLNDNAPVFTPYSIKRSPSNNDINIPVPADKIGYLGRVLATDADSDGPNSQLDYELVDSQNGKYTIDKFGQIYTQEGLKPEQQVHLKVKAKDNGEPVQTTEVTIVLKALGRNNKFSLSNRPPKLVDKELWQELHVSDSDSVGVIIGLVKAQDEDNDPLWFKIDDSEGVRNPNQTFVFQGNSGELVLARSISLLDSKRNVIELPFVVSDGTDQVKDTIKIRISRSTITRPKFQTNDSFINLPMSNIPSGFVPFTANAIFDETQTGISHPHQIIYAIHCVDDLNAAEIIKIDSSNGNLIIEKTPAHRLANNFTVVISAKVGNKINFAQVHFYVLPMNEHTPEFIFEQYEFELTDSVDGTKFIGQVEAYDPDLNEFGQINYSIISGNEFGLFTVNSTSGEIYMSGSLENNKTSFTKALLTIRASDAATVPRSNTCTVKIKQSNIQNNKLNELQLESFFITINDDVDPDGILKSINVLNSNAVPGLITYSFLNSCKLLRINALNGKLRANNFIDSHTSIQNCTILVESVDLQINQKAIIYIKLISKKALELQFQSNNYYGSVEENSLPGTIVNLFVNKNELNASNLSKLNGILLKQNHHLNGSPIKLRILSPTEKYFTIDTAKNNLQTNNPIDFEEVYFRYL